MTRVPSDQVIRIFAFYVWDSHIGKIIAQPRKELDPASNVQGPSILEVSATWAMSTLATRFYKKHLKCFREHQSQFCNIKKK